MNGKVEVMRKAWPYAPSVCVAGMLGRELKESWRLGLGSDSVCGNDKGTRLMTCCWVGVWVVGGHLGPLGVGVEKGR